MLQGTQVPSAPKDTLRSFTDSHHPTDGDGLLGQTMQLSYQKLPREVPKQIWSVIEYGRG